MTRLHHPSSIPGLLGSVTEQGAPLVLTPEGYVALGTAAVSILGRVPTEGDLPPDEPPGSNIRGDGYITDDDNHLWVWDGDQWVDTGPWTTEHHDDLVDVSANQHHNQIHLLYGSDHSDVDTATPLESRHVLAVPAGLGDWTPEFRMNWRSEWIDGVYYEHDVVRDGDWLMAANKETTDKAGPVAVGDPYFPYAGTNPAASTLAKTLITGNRYSFPEAGYLGGYRLNVVPGYHYTVYLIVDPDGIRDIRQLIDFNAISTGWVENSVSPVLVAGGTVFELLAYISEPDPTPTTWVGNWNYTTPNNENTPGAGTASQANKLLGVLKVNKTDADGGDREAELLALTIGDTISIASMSWVIQTITESGNVVEFGIAPATQGSDGEQEFTFGTVTATPIPYLEDPDYWLSNSYVEGVYSDTGAAGIVLNQNAYGVDVYVQRMSMSDDWDVMAITGASGGDGGEGEGTNPLPPGGLTDEVLTKIDGQDYNVEWAEPAAGVPHTVTPTEPPAPELNEVWVDPTADSPPPSSNYLPLAGGTMTGNIDMNQRYVTNAQIVQSTVFGPAAGNPLYLWDGNGQRIVITGGAYITLYDTDGSTPLLNAGFGTARFFVSLNMDSNKITSLLDPTDDLDAVNKLYADQFLPHVGGTITGAILTNYDPENEPNDDLMLITKRYVDESISAVPSNYLPITGGAVTGGQSLAQSRVRNITISNTEPANPLTGDMWMEIV